MKTFALLCCLLLSGLLGRSQQLELHYREKSLSEILLDLRDRYDLQFSFDNEQLSNYKITIDHSFQGLPQTLDFLLKDLPLTYEKAGKVFLIYSIPHVKPVIYFRISGVVEDEFSGESLPYAHLYLNESGMLTDRNGAFSWQTVADSLVRVQISYLGYFPLDTFVAGGTVARFKLKPALIRLKEIKVEGLSVVRSEQIGQQAGEIRLNQKVAGSLPGYGDNSVFNLLRLQPGILAAGEQSNDLMIRGSYEGQSQVLFDGFTLFGMKNFNDNISAVNPFMAKDIRVMKGGFPAELGGRVGGVVEITGVNGSTDDLQMQLSVNNMTMNGWLNLPLGDNNALVVAMRQTYYELYDKNQLTLGTSGRTGRGSSIDRYVYPDYNFRDLNVKFSGKTDSGDFYSFSFFRGDDSYVYGLEYETRSQQNQLSYEDEEDNLQYGASARYSKAWHNGLRSELTVAYSSLETQVTNLRESAGQQGGSGTGGSGNGQGGSATSGTSWITDTDDYNQNKIGELRLVLQNHLAIGESQRLGFGLGLTQNRVHYREDSFDVNLAHDENTLTRVNGYFEDHWAVSRQLQVTGGLRADLPFDLDRLDLQPRFSAAWAITDSWKATAAVGTYRQYISHSSVVDPLGNFRYLWTLCNNDDIPVLESQQAILGISWHKNGYLLSVEGYRKHTTGLSRYVDMPDGTGLYKGEAQTKGLDLLIKKDWKGHSLWVAYTLSETKEHFSYFDTADYLRALHDQRHELKTALLLNFKPVYISANYVYGSGFPGLPDDPAVGNRAYQRMDAAVSYRLNKPKYSLEVGVSILNVFNYENIKYDNFVRIPDDQDATLNVSAEAVPFTPAMFVKVAF
ncbi:TonB-dependent receptor plug domain-containing protein [Mangrovibacterium marinum]|uniref:TonB-dependent receptor-like protein n=1 Tax=Mangrovibacterium marinum TaxID=1639118 RepID=A0A2T5C1V3_9BACT|nr:TonB-dependent receptor plug domain-containing protein [Mangrovibacterium marinum]PTN08602.1 TonB-dependent receptor-like protein [Mangrovibacterium marinum]